MADHRGPSDKNYNYKNEDQPKYAEQETSTESSMIYQLNQQREYHIRKLMDIQNAIDSVRAIR